MGPKAPNPAPAKPAQPVKPVPVPVVAKTEPEPEEKRAPEYPVNHDTANKRFIINLPDSAICYLTYDIEDKVITFNEIFVPQDTQGNDLGSNLAKAAFKFAESNQFDVVVKNGFLAEFYKRKRRKYPYIRVIGRYPPGSHDPHY